MANQNLSAAKSAKNDEFYTQYAPQMCGLKWGELYAKYHNTSYDQPALSRRADELMLDENPCLFLRAKLEKVIYADIYIYCGLTFGGESWYSSGHD